MSKFGDIIEDVIFGKRAKTLMGVSSLMFWIVCCPIMRDGFNSVYNYLSNYFGWKFEWYRFLEGFSHFWSIQMLFAVIYIISIFGMLKYPVLKDGEDGYIGNGVPASWLIISIVFLTLGNFPPYALITLPLLYIIVLAVCAIIKNSAEKFFGLLVIGLVLISPVFILWNMVSGESGSGK